LDKLYTLLRDNYQTRSGKNIAPCTLGHVHAYIKAILEYAVKKKIIKSNPAKELDDYPTIKCGEKGCYTEEQIRQILNADIPMSKFVKNHTFYKKRFKAFTRVAIYGCLRRSEMSGLNWDDLLVKDCALRIERSASTVKGLGLTLLETKNEASEDIVAVSEDTIKALLEYKQEIELLFGEEMTSPGKAIFISQSGNRLAPQALNDMWNNYIKTTDLPQYTLHSLRHSGGTLALHSSKDMKGTSKHLRHSSTSVTEKTYIHYNLEEEKKIMNRVQNRLNNEFDKQININVTKNEMERFINNFIEQPEQKETLITIEPLKRFMLDFVKEFS